MNKNLKKVISAAAALTVTASSFAAFAATFPDVADDASYSQAVQELSALGVISGFDDGTFGPDQLVTRAQMAKMIVDALNEGAQAEASAGSTQFTDAQGHWAAGYINQGVTDGWIAGYSSTQFGPDDNVTYVQAQKMIVAALGYSYYAEAAGGWPSGYKLYASQNDITVGVEGVSSDDQELTRAQVAQMIDNGMDAPLCKITGWNVEWNGTQTPKITVKDGTGEGYQTLLTDRHDAYKVYGRVTATSRSTGSSLDTDQVTFQVEKADNFDDEYIKSNDESTYRTEDMYFGDTDAVNMIRTYAQAIIQIDDDDEFTILSIVPAAANKTVDLLSDDIDDSKSKVGTGDTDVLYFYPTGTTRNSVKYELADSVDLYVNGVDMGTFDYDAYEKYIVNDETNKVTLQKETNYGSTSTSTKYNVIMISAYTTAIVDEVTEKTDQVVINFKEQGSDAKSKMTIELDDEDYTYSFTLNGEEIDPAELQEYDVLSIAYDNDAGFGDSYFYDVEVSRDTVEGKYTSYSATNKKWTVGGTAYKAASGREDAIGMDTSTEYTLYLDVFGRIAYVDEIANSKKYGILKNVYEKSNGDWAADVITKDGGEPITYTLDDADGEKYEKLIAEAYTKATDAGATFDTDGNMIDEKASTYPYLVIEYKVSSSGKLTIKSDDEKCEDPKLAGSKAEGEYKENSGKIGSLKVSDATVIIDISNVDAKKDDYKITSVDNLKDGTTYVAYGYDKSTSDSVYRLVIITDGMGGIDSTSELAIVVETSTDTNDDGDDVNAVTLFYQGEEVTYFVDNDSDADNVAEDLVEGEPIIFSTNSSGDIDDIMRVFKDADLLDRDSDTFLDLVDDFVNGNVQAYDEKAWQKALTDGDEDDVTIKTGVVLKPYSGSNYVFAESFEKGSKGEIFVNLNDSDATFDFSTSDATIYGYNFANNKKNNGRLELDTGMVYTANMTAAYENGDKSDDRYNIVYEDLMNTDNDEYDIVLAVARVFDQDDVQEIYLIYVD